MKQIHVGKHLMALFLVICLVIQCAMPIGAVADAEAGDRLHWEKLSADQISAELTRKDLAAEETQTEAPYSAEEPVRVSIVLEQPSVIEKGFGLKDLALNSSAVQYRAGLEQMQMQVTDRICAEALGGARLEVQWNLTLAANLISATVPYGAIEDIASVAGVKAVYLENRYEIFEPETAEPNTVTSGATMVGTANAWELGYTGAGTRVAIVDTGIDPDHQSFDNGAYLYSLYRLGSEAVAAGEFATVDAYIESLDLLDVEEIQSVLPQLNATKRFSGRLAAQNLYDTAKLPFNFNYVDKDLDVSHDNDTQGGHGSHVAGIAGANYYIPGENGTYEVAKDTVYAVGQAPDAQIISMKVAGKGGGIFDSDYMAALEDAIVLGCDVVNMSFGSSNIGKTYSGNDYYDALYDSLQGTGLVLVNSGGNAYSYAQFAANGVPYLHADDVNNGRIGSPSAYPNALSAASVDNTGFTGPTTTFHGAQEVVTAVTDAGNAPAGFRSWYTLDTSEDGSGTEYEYVFLGDPSALLVPGYAGEDAANYMGAPADFEGLELEGKIVLVARGSLSFYEKHINAVNAGAAAVIVYNNTSGVINMDLSSTTVTNPCCFLQLGDAMKVFAGASRDESGVWGGTMEVERRATILYGEEDAPISFSEFSSWGVPDDLSMKPEITAVGGNVYSVDGEKPGGKDYIAMSGTSMSSPQVAGMSALLEQYIRETGLEETTGLSSRTLTQSLLMGTANPIIEQETGLPYSIRRQGSGLANVTDAISAGAYVLVGEAEGNDGKVKVELGDDPARAGSYTVDFTVHNIQDTDLAYDLSAMLLSPGVASDGVSLYMLNTMVELSPEVCYESDAKVVSYCQDFDGDLDADMDDFQRLLDYLAGNAAGICNLEYADLSGNGTVDEFDAYVLLEQLEKGTCTVKDEVLMVPAGGSARVKMTLELSQEDRAYIDSCFENGTYVEGFIHLASLADAEGALDVDQSIPVLGFYGKWSDGSMFDRGDFTQDYYNALNGTPTDFYTTNANTANYMVAKMGGEKYYYGLNYFLTDKMYLPERASLNSTNGDGISRIYYSLIRNSAATKVLVTDDVTGEVYLEKNLGEQLAAFYYLAGSMWTNNNLSAGINWKGTDAQGNPLPDGTRATVSLIAASEYYRNADGSVRWEELGDGAVYSMPVLIDNQAPELLAATQVIDSLTGETSYHIEMQDNHYTAAMFLLNSTGSKILGTLPINQTEEGAEALVSFQMSGIIGSEFILALADYAGNLSYYAISLLTDSASGNLYGFNTAFDSWVNFGPGVKGNETVVSTTDKTFVAGDYAEGFVFAASEDGSLYATDMNDMSVSHKIGDLLYSYIGMVYDEATGKLYGARSYGNGKTYLYDISLTNGAERFVRSLSVELQAIAAAGDGSFYGLTAEGDLYHVTDTANVLIGNVGQKISGIQALCFSDGKLYWAVGTSLVEISLTDAACTVVGELSGVTTCLVSLEAAGGSFSDGDQVTSMVISRGTMTLYAGNQAKLEARVRPWYADDKTVTWSSDNEAVATVDENGLVTAVSIGTATITATSNLTPSISASCVVTVASLDQQIHAAANVDGRGSLLYRDLKTGENSVTAVKDLYDVIAATVDAKTGNLWVADEMGTIHHVDPAGTILESVESASGVPIADMAPSALYDGYYSVSGAYLLVPTPYGENAPGSGFDMTSYLAQQTGATAFVAVASMGAGNNGGVECDVILALDNSGTLWQFFVAAAGESYSANLGVIQTGLGSLNNGCTATFDPAYGTAGGLMVSRNNGDGTSTIVMVDGANTTSVSELANLPYVPVAVYTPAPAAEEPAQDLPMMTQLLDLQLEAQIISAER